jgi:pimeloyl-ACP methyl ester carboxylesterase
MAHDAIGFIEAMGVQRVDLLGFSIGSFVKAKRSLIRPDILRRVVLVAAPQGAAGMHGWAPEVIGAVGQPETSPEGYVSVFFTAWTPAAKRAGRPPGASSGEGRPTGTSRRRGRPVRRSTTQVRLGYTESLPLLERVAAIGLPVFVAAGDSDPMILPRYSHLLAGLLPDARLTIYPDSAHGFLFQHHNRFAADVHLPRRRRLTTSPGGLARTAQLFLHSAEANRHARDDRRLITLRS